MPPCTMTETKKMFISLLINHPELAGQLFALGGSDIQNCDFHLHV